MKRMKSKYLLTWELERDIFFFDTLLFPYFRKNKLNCHNSWEYCKKNDWTWYKIMSRLYQDAVGKMYMQTAFQAPKRFEIELKKKYENQSPQRIAKDKIYRIDTYDEDIEAMLHGELS